MPSTEDSGLAELRALARAVQAAKNEPASSSARYEGAAVALARHLQTLSRADRSPAGDATVLPIEVFQALDAGSWMQLQQRYDLAVVKRDKKEQLRGIVQPRGKTR